MINSHFISDILELLLDNDEVGIQAKKQIPYLIDSKYKYTANGLYVIFKHDAGIGQFRLKSKCEVLNGVDVILPGIMEAEAILFFKEGLIHYLEICCRIGDYPMNEIIHYRISQSWIGSPGKKIVR